MYKNVGALAVINYLQNVYFTMITTIENEMIFLL